VRLPNDNLLIPYNS